MIQLTALHWSASYRTGDDAMLRKTDGCTNCGEIREIAAHGLCFKCYRKDERAADRKFATVNRHGPAIRREHKKLFHGFTSLMVGLSDLGVSHPDVIRIRGIIHPYLRPIATFLMPAPVSEDAGVEVNGEHQSGTLFTVHTEPDVTLPYPKRNAAEVTGGNTPTTVEEGAVRIRAAAPQNERR
jgi:hypothetical protein